MLGEDAAGSGDFLAPKQEDNAENVYDFDGVIYSEEELKTKSFEGKPAWQRFIICIAGVFNNFLLGFFDCPFPHRNDWGTASQNCCLQCIYSCHGKRFTGGR